MVQMTNTEIYLQNSKVQLIIFEVLNKKLDGLGDKLQGLDD